MEYIITSENDYHETMILIYDLMNKGEVNLSESDVDQLAKMTLATEKFENDMPGYGL